MSGCEHTCHHERRAEPELDDAAQRAALERQRDELLANVSHDLSTPVAAIKASIGVVLAHEPPGTPEPLHRMFVNIDLAADRLATLVGDLLELTRLQAGRVRPRLDWCDARSIVLRTAATIEPLAERRGQRVVVTVPPEPVILRADAGRLERALQNLLGNAHKYGREGGRIELTLSAGPDEVLLTVADDGPGIPEAERERIFERFYRPATEATRRNQGSGLGLPIARAMVELHGGQIEVASQPGAGSWFTIHLPVDGAKAAGDAPRRTAPRRAATPGDVALDGAGPDKIALNDRCPGEDDGYEDSRCR